MDPISAIVTALVIGATEAVKGVAGDAVRDAYAGLKALIKSRFAKVAGDVDQLETEPDSKGRRAVVEEGLQKANAGQDTEVIAKAQALLDQVKDSAAAAKAIGVDLKDVQAANLRLRNIVASGGGVRVEQGRFMGDIEITDVRAGVSGPA
jgi:hypothetical protein